MTMKEKRWVHHSVKMSQTEDEILQQKMKAFGVSNLSAFLRAMVLNGYVLKLDIPEIKELIRLLKNLTNNVNQIARRLNEHGSIYETEIDEIKDGQKEIWNILNQILIILRSPNG